MVDNLAEKIDMCSLNRGRWVLFAYNWDHKNCPLYGVAGFPLFRGCLSTEVNGRTVGSFRIVHYIVGVRCWGMLPLYTRECFYQDKRLGYESGGLGMRAVVAWEWGWWWPGNEAGGSLGMSLVVAWGWGGLEIVHMYSMYPHYKPTISPRHYTM